MASLFGLRSQSLVSSFARCCKKCRNRTVELWLDSLDPLKELAKLYKTIKE